MQMHSWMNGPLGVVRQEDKLQFESLKPAAELRGLGASGRKSRRAGRQAGRQKQTGKQALLLLCLQSGKLYIALAGAQSTNDTFESNVHKYQINNMQIS